jgi:hypothetical protein
LKLPLFGVVVVAVNRVAHFAQIVSQRLFAVADQRDPLEGKRDGGQNNEDRTSDDELEKRETLIEMPWTSENALAPGPGTR